MDTTPKLVIIMIGLPARGKSYIVRKLARYLNWLQYETRVFNVGERRRIADHSGSNGSKTGDREYSSAAFFNPTDPDLVSIRDQLALETLNELLAWRDATNDSRIGILDATNSTPQRRKRILDHIWATTGTLDGVLFFESCCYDHDILERNFRLKLDGPDYRTQDPEIALQDFRRRVAFYEKSYVALGAAEEQQKIPFLQVIDVGRKINTHLIQEFLSKQVVEYMLNFNLSERQIWIFCGGESVDDSVGRIGRPSPLTCSGQQYAAAMTKFVKSERVRWEESAAAKRAKRNSNIVASSASEPERPKFSVWTSTMPQTIDTAAGFDDDFSKSEIKMLDDLNAGDMAGMSFEEISAQHKSVYEARRKYKLQYRWPGLGGESYLDLTQRLRPVILEIERRKDHMLVITHRAVVRVLLSYFLDLRRDDLAEMPVPLNWGFSLQPTPYGIEFSAYSYEAASGKFTLVPNAREQFFSR